MLSGLCVQLTVRLLRDAAHVSGHDPLSEGGVILG
jgi:hypothetical protein